MKPDLIFYLIDFFVIMAACMAAAWAESKIRSWRDKDLDLGCDSCDQILPLKHTPEGDRWLCRPCFKAYQTEHPEIFTEDKIRTAAKGYRRRTKKRNSR